MTQHIEYWRPGTPESPATVWTAHGLGTREDQTETVDEDVLCFRGDFEEDGAVQLTWFVLPSRSGPPTWHFKDLDQLESNTKAWALEGDHMALIDDETGDVVRELSI